MYDYFFDSQQAVLEFHSVRVLWEELMLYQELIYNLEPILTTRGVRYYLTKKFELN